MWPGTDACCLEHRCTETAGLWWGHLSSVENSEEDCFSSRMIFLIDLYRKMLLDCWLEIYLSLDDEGTVSTNGDLLLHNTEVVEPADEESCTVGTQVEVHIITCETNVERMRGRCEYLDNNGGKKQPN